MGAPELLAKLAAAGLNLRAVEGGRVSVTPREALTPELRQLILQNKPALIAELAHAGLCEKALQMLAADPALKRAAAFDTDAEPEAVLCAVAVRGGGSGVLRIPRARFDGWLVLDALGRAEQ